MRGDTVLLAVFLMFSCAKQAFPPGGPEDKTPPEIIGMFPEMGALNVPLNTEIRVLFDEPIQRGSAEDHIFITPNPGAGVHFKWRRKQLRIRFTGNLDSNRTYVIAMGSGIRDYRNNTMTKTTILAFSTGSELDQGKIDGHVYTEDTGVSVWAYPLGGQAPDPRIEQPEYVVQCGKDGSFQFSYLARKLYRLFAVLDRRADLLYQPVEDAVGLTNRDIDLRSVPSAGRVFSDDAGRYACSAPASCRFDTKQSDFSAVQRTGSAHGFSEDQPDARGFRNPAIDSGGILSGSGKRAEDSG